MNDFFTNDNLNIGVVLGGASGGLIDIDLDDPDALRFAPHFLPETDSIFGRASNPKSHWLYKVPDPQGSKKFSAGSDGMIVEIRGNGSQTVFPGSVHESGEAIFFDANGEPGRSTWAELERAAAKIAIATLAFKAWRKGTRHSLALALSGFLASRGWTQGDVEALIEAIAQEASDEEMSDRLTCVRTTFETSQRGGNVVWRRDLESLLGQQTLGALKKWLPVSQDSSAVNVSSAPLQLDLLTDAGRSDAFAEAQRDQLIWAVGQDTWYRRQNEIYQEADPTAVQGMAKYFLQEAVKSYGAFAKTALSKGQINAAIELSRDALSHDSRKFDVDPNLFGTLDGSVLDLARQETVHPSSVVTKRSGVSFDPNAQCPKWESFLTRIFEGDEETISFLQRAVGYSLSGSVQEQALFILIGKGANGKSTFIKTLLHLFDDYATTVPMQTLMDQGKLANQTNDLASLVGMRFVAASEGEQDQKLAESKIKLMTGGDRLKCRHLYKDYFEFDPTFKLWLATNNLPSITGSDDAVWRRLRIIEFPVSIPAHEQDPHLSGALLDELPGILNWALAGHAAWKRQGLQPPEKVMASTRSYREDNDIIGQWISSCCVTTNCSAAAPVKSLYEDYSRWCLNSGWAPVPSNSFGKELSRKGFDNVRGRNGNRRKGIALLETLDTESGCRFAEASCQ